MTIETVVVTDMTAMPHFQVLVLRRQNNHFIGVVFDLHRVLLIMAGITFEIGGIRLRFDQIRRRESRGAWLNESEINQRDRRTEGWMPPEVQQKAARQETKT